MEQPRLPTLATPRVRQAIAQLARSLQRAQRGVKLCLALVRTVSRCLDARCSAGISSVPRRLPFAPCGMRRNRRTKVSASRVPKRKWVARLNFNFNFDFNYIDIDIDIDSYLRLQAKMGLQID
ncbi:hypothetical protein GTR04_0616 [Trichophyton interdigitale]|uniref:Uncharacterized protein n=1 Tax=Trichophyton interdigitale TaxID=101480 RepID=A0A9P4YFE0_9EURO|nr:hypothetical protein GY632_4461 [Trichophyton interdigitale]KAF3897882.1 hypothetical protein GY631_1385 [Trichophyton interdigitale]KAG8211991.1 hypothetical protein GTR04_0616 [Trichophyton interdigitale]